MLSTKIWTVGYKVMGALIAILILGAIVLVSINNAQLRAENQDMYADLQASQDNAQELYEQLLDEGVEPEGEAPEEVAPPTVVEKPKDGDDGKDGKDAPPPTSAQMNAAVAQCFAAGLCVAPEGAPGGPGEDGEDGRDAPAPTAEELQAAVQQCFAAGLCVAPTGPEGPQGGQGPAGPTCPEGYTPMSVWLTVSDEEIGIPRQQQAIVCLPTTPPSEGETP